MILALLSLTSFGCGGGGSNGTSSNPASPANSTLPVSVSPTTGTQAAEAQLAVTPSAVSFGSLLLGSATSQNLQLTNAGAAPLTVSSVITRGAAFSVSGPGMPLSLDAGQTATLQVNFSPSNTGTATGNVVITSSNQSPTTISLSGTGFVQGAHSVTLSWTPSTSSVIGYNVYRSMQSVGPYAKNNPVLESSTSYTDFNVTSGQTYFYSVTAVNAQNAESGFSAPVTASIPTP